MTVLSLKSSPHNQREGELRKEELTWWQRRQDGGGGDRFPHN